MREAYLPGPAPAKRVLGEREKKLELGMPFSALQRLEETLPLGSPPTFLVLGKQAGQQPPCTLSPALDLRILSWSLCALLAPGPGWTQPLPSSFPGLAASRALGWREELRLA